MAHEKADSIRSKADRAIENGTCASLCTLVAASVAFSLSLVAILAVGGNGLQQYDLLTLNTSTLFQNAVKIYNTNPTQSRSLDLDDGRHGVVLPRVTERAFLPPPVEARQFPAPPDIVPFFSTLLPAAPSPTPYPGNNGGGNRGGGGGPGRGDGGNFLQNFEGLFNGLLGAATGAVGGEFIKVVNGLVSQVLDALGIDEYYSLYSNQFCSGYYTPNYASPDAKRSTKKCTRYDQVASNRTNSTLQLGTTVIDVSALNIPNKLADGSGMISKVFKALFAIQITGLVATGLLILLTPLNLCISFFKRSTFRSIITALAGLAAACFGVTAFIYTAIIVVTSTLVNTLGKGLGIESLKGGNFLALIWISAVFMSISLIVRYLKWHKQRYVKRSKADFVSRPVAQSAKSEYQLGPEGRGGVGE
ncbi:uncharacterized protein RAG0_15531 [Rhynchosporium agropyri]|uniref:Uncharacterized protein n=2 Tax=Rhynchosporium TaxID=38037 RepID=A0A1E1MIU4_RHYSE|nr:uncharacterized protein RAG0_15531 [Rhynchosporium agropyri]CZT49018.1 uncharacterized protein RSE6_09799 [Rhynchosporium secalis]